MTIHHCEDVMGTVVTIDVYLAADATASRAAAARERVARGLRRPAPRR